MTPHTVQLLSGTALNILRQILIGQEHVTLISQWYGETVGFWDDETRPREEVDLFDFSND